MATECLHTSDAALGDADAHLSTCGVCQSLIGRERAIWSAVGALPRKSVAPQLRATILAAAARAIDEVPEEKPRTKRDVRTKILADAQTFALGALPSSLPQFRSVPAAMTAPVVP